MRVRIFNSDCDMLNIVGEVVAESFKPGHCRQNINWELGRKGRGLSRYRRIAGNVFVLSEPRVHDAENGAEENDTVPNDCQIGIFTRGMSKSHVHRPYTQVSIEGGT